MEREQLDPIVLRRVSFVGADFFSTKTWVSLFAQDSDNLADWIGGAESPL